MSMYCVAPSEGGKANILTVEGKETTDSIHQLNGAETIRVFHVDYEEACRLIHNSSGRTFHVHVDQFAPPKVEFGPAFRVAAYVRVSRLSALQFLNDAYYAHRDRADVRIAFLGSCFFIG